MIKSSLSRYSPLHEPLNLWVGVSEEGPSILYIIGKLNISTFQNSLLAICNSQLKCFFDHFKKWTKFSKLFWEKLLSSISSYFLALSSIIFMVEVWWDRNTHLSVEKMIYKYLICNFGLFWTIFPRWPTKRQISVIENS